MNARVRPEPRFIQALRKLPPDRAKAAAETLVKFSEEPSLPSLAFRSLKGRPGYFIINARRGDRLILRREEDDLYAAVDVGPHDNIYRRWDRSS